MKSTLFGRDDLLRHAHLIITKEQFTHEDSARANALMTLAEKLDGRGAALGEDSPEARALNRFLRNQESRALGVGSPTQTTSTSPLVPQAFYNKLIVALKAFDQLFDDNVVSVVEVKTGAPLVMPLLDDSAQAAQQIPESNEDAAIGDPVTGATVVSAETFRSGMVRVSHELLQDAGVPLADILGQAFAIRLVRGIGPVLVTALLSGAKSGRTATGSAASTGGSETGANSVGWADLTALVKSVNPAYRATEKVWWLMNDNSLLALDSVITKQGLSMIHPQYDSEGRRTLLGYPVAICPSMPDIGANATPIAFGATGYFNTITIKDGTAIKALFERFVEYGQVGYRAQMRANGVLLAVTASDSPVKVLTNAAA